MTTGAPSFDTERLSVAGWHDAPIPAAPAQTLARIVSSLLTESVTAQLPPDWQGAFSEARANEWIRDRDAEGSTMLVSTRPAGGPVGLVLFHGLQSGDSESNELRLGYLIEESQWGKGYASELVGGVVRWARAQGFISIVAGVPSDNVPSARVLEKNGFSRLREEQGLSVEDFFRIVL